MRFSETVVGAGFAVAGALIVGATLSYPPGEPGQPGPALFPRLVGALMIGFGGWLAVQGARAGGGGEPVAWRRRLASAGFQNALFVIGAVLFYILVAERLGFLVTSAVILFGLMWRLAVRPVVAGLVAVGFSLFVYALFSTLLRVPLPGGLLWW
jgi:putative tricarboxylic transport membrane protein